MSGPFSCGVLAVWLQVRDCSGGREYRERLTIPAHSEFIAQWSDNILIVGENCGRFLRRKESTFKKITLLCLELFGEKRDKAEEYNNDIEGFSQVTLCYLPIKLFYLMYLLMLLLHGCAFLNKIQLFHLVFVRVILVNTVLIHPFSLLYKMVFYYRIVECMYILKYIKYC